MKPLQLIEEQFLKIFNTESETEVQKALDKLKELGLSDEQIISGIKAGCDHIKKECSINITKRKVS